MQQVRGGLQQPPTVLLGVVRRPRGDVETLAQRRNDSGEVGCARTQLSGHCLDVAVLQVGCEYLDERLIRRSKGALFVAMANQWASDRFLHHPTECSLGSAGAAASPRSSKLRVSSA